MISNIYLNNKIYLNHIVKWHPNQWKKMKYNFNKHPIIAVKLLTPCDAAT